MSSPQLEGEKPTSSTMSDTDMKKRRVDRVLVTTTSRRTLEDQEGPRKVDLTVVYFRLKKTTSFATRPERKYFALEQPHTAPLIEDEKDFFQRGGELPKIDEGRWNSMLQEGTSGLQIPYKVQKPYFTGKKKLNELGTVNAEYTIGTTNNLDPDQKAERLTFKYIEENVIQKLNEELNSGKESFQEASLPSDWFEKLELSLSKEDLLLKRE